MRVIIYTLHELSKAERNYPPHKKELFSLKLTVCDKFKDYLYGQEFSLFGEKHLFKCTK